MSKTEIQKRKDSTISPEVEAILRNRISNAKRFIGANTFYLDDRDYPAATESYVEDENGLLSPEKNGEPEGTWGKALDFVRSGWTTVFNGSDKKKIMQSTGENAKEVSQELIAQEYLKNEASKDPAFFDLMKTLEFIKKQKDVASMDREQPISSEGAGAYNINGTKQLSVPPMYKSALGDRIRMEAKNGAIQGRYAPVLDGSHDLNITIDDVPDDKKELFAKYSGFIDAYTRVHKDINPTTFEKMSIAGKAIGSILGAQSERGSAGSVKKDLRTYELIKELVKTQKISSDYEAIDMPDAYELANYKNNTKELVSKVDRMTDISRRKYDKNLEIIHERYNSIDARQGDVSKYFQDKVDSGSELYSIPEGLGLSLSMMSDSFASMAFEGAATALTKNAGSAVRFGAAVASFGANVWTNANARQMESTLEFAENRKERLNLALAGKLPNNATSIEALDDNSLINLLDSSDSNSLEAKKRYMEMLSKDGFLSKSAKKDLVSGLESRYYKSNNKDVDNGILEANEGAVEYFKQQYSNVLGDVATQAMVMVPIAARLKTAARMAKYLTKLKESSKVTGAILGAGEKVVASSNRFFDSRFGKYAGIPLKMAVSAGFEGVEEIQQYTAGKRYVHGDQGENKTLVGSLIDGYKEAGTGVLAAMGMYTDEAYIDVDDLRKNMRAGFITGMLIPMPGAAMQTYGQIMDHADDKKTERVGKIINSFITNRAVNAGIMEKSAHYVNEAFKGNETNVIKALNKLKDNLPEGMTKEDLDDEINMAYDTMRLASDPKLTKYISESDKYGSDEHKLIVGLVQKHMYEYNNGVDEMNAQMADLKEPESNPSLYSGTINNYIDSVERKAIDESTEDNPFQGFSTDQRAKLAALIAKRVATKHLFDTAKSHADEIANDDNSLAGVYRLLGEDDNLSYNEKGDEAKVLPHYTKALNSKLDLIDSTIAQIMREAGLENKISDIINSANSVQTYQIKKKFLSPLKLTLAAAAGLEYDAMMINKLQGMETNENGETVDTDETDHFSFLDSIISEYKGARQSEARRSNDIDAEREAAIAEEKAKRARIEEEKEKEKLENEIKNNVVVVDNNKSKEENPDPKPVVPPVVTAPVVESKSEKELIAEESGNAFWERLGVDVPSRSMNPVETESSEVVEVIVETPEVVVEAPAPADKVELILNPKISADAELAAKIEEKQIIEDAIIESMEDEDGIVKNILIDDGVIDQAYNSDGYFGKSKIGELMEPDPKNNPVEYANYTEFLKNGIEDELASGTTVEYIVLTYRNGSYEPVKQVDALVYLDKLKKNEYRVINGKIVTADDQKSLNNEWDRMYIGIKVDRPGNKGFLLGIRNPYAAHDAKKNTGGKVSYSTAEIKDLKEYRDVLLESLLDNIAKDSPINLAPKMTIRPHGIKNNRQQIAPDVYISIQRPLHEIPGLPMPRKQNGEVDFAKINSENTPIAIGMGLHEPTGLNEITTFRGLTVRKENTEEWKENRGNVFILVKRDGRSANRPIPIKINNVGLGKFSEANPSTDKSNSIIDIITDLIVNGKLSSSKESRVEVIDGKARLITKDEITSGREISISLSPKDIVTTLIHSGFRTATAAAKKEYLKEKEFYTSGGIIKAQSTVALLEDLGTRGLNAVSKFLNESAKFSVSKENVVRSTDNGVFDKTVSEVLGGLKDKFSFYRINSLEIANGLTIEKADLELTWLGFLIKNNLIVSDVVDEVFWETKYVSVGGTRTTASVDMKDGSKATSGSIPGTQITFATTSNQVPQTPVKTPENASKGTSTGTAAQTQSEAARQAKLVLDEVSENAKFMTLENPNADFYVNEKLLTEIRKRPGFNALSKEEKVIAEKEANYTRVTSYAEPEDEAKRKAEDKARGKVNPAGDTAVDFGNKVDRFIRDFFAGTLHKDMSKYQLASNDILNDFVVQLSRMKALMDNRGEIVYPKNMVLYNDDLKIAGSVDLITYDKDGNIRIYDIKTMNGDNISKNKDRKGVLKFDSTIYGRSQRQKYSEQLSLYRILLNNTHGVLAKSISILPIELEYSSFADRTNKLEILKWVNVTPIEKIGDAQIIPQSKRIINDNSTSADIKPKENVPTRVRSSKVAITKDGKISGAPVIPSSSIAETGAIISKNTDRSKIERAYTNKPIGRVINLIEEVAWLKRVLGLKDNELDILDEVIELAGNRQAMGMLTSSAILLYKGAEEGTAYHEAYHKVSLLLMSRAERKHIYKLLLEQDKSLAGLNLTDLQLEEILAEKFRDYMLSGPVANDVLGVKLAFRRILNFIRPIVGLKRKDLNRLFEDINLGVFRGRKVKSNRVKEFISKYGVGAEKQYSKLDLKTMSIEDYNNVIRGLTSTMFRDAGIEKAMDAAKISKSSFNDLYNKLAAEMHKNTLDYEETDNVASKNRADLYLEILTNWDDVFEPKIKETIGYLGFREIDEEDNQYSDESVGVTEAQNARPSYEFSRADAVKPEIKAFILMMPEMIAAGEGIFIPKVNPITGFNSFVDPKVAINRLLYDLGTANTFQAMMDRIESRSNDPFYGSLAQRLLNQPESFRTKFHNAVKNQRHEFISIATTGWGTSDTRTVVRDTSVEDRINVLSSSWGSLFESDPTIYTEAEDGSTSLTKLNPLDSGSISTLRSIINSFDELKQKADSLDYETNSRELLKILSSVGINIDQTTLDYKFQNVNGSKAKAIATFIKGGSLTDKNSLSDLFNGSLSILEQNNGEYVRSSDSSRLSIANLFKSKKAVKDLARLYLVTNPDPMEVSVTGVDGAKLYAISQNNFMSDQANRLTDEPEYTEKLARTSYAGGLDGQGSMVLSQLMEETRRGEPHKLQLKTFVKVYKEGVGDDGADYFKMTPMEDYMAKMALSTNDFIVLPTMADKKRYNALAGIRLLNSSQDKFTVGFREVKVKKGEKPKHEVFIDPSQSIISRFEQYLYAEFMAIKDAANEYKKYVNESNPNEIGANGRPVLSNLYDTYHYFLKGNTIKQGNGLRFRHMNLTVPGKDGKPISLNAYLDRVEEASGLNGGINGVLEAIDLLESTLFAGVFSNKFNPEVITKSDTSRRDAIRLTIDALVKKELDFAKELGLFDTPHGGISGLRSKGLDSAALQAYRNEYGRETSKFEGDAEIINHMETSAIVNLIGRHAINTAVGIIEYEKVFSKDPAFHKNNDNNIKRHATVLSTGDTPRADFPVGHRLHNKKTYVTVETKDRIIKSRVLDALKVNMASAVANRLLSIAGIPSIENMPTLLVSTKEEIVASVGELDAPIVISAINQANERVGDSVFGYDRVDESDATALASDEFYLNYIESVDGISEEDVELIQYLNSADLSWMGDPDICERMSRLKLQPLKLIHVGEVFSDDGKLCVPKINKMAVFPVWKFLAQGDLSYIYDAMHDESNPIDMVLVRQAVKAGNNIGQPTHDENDKPLSIKNAVREVQELRNLRKQMPTDPHLTPTQTLGTQPNKMAMSNINRNKEYKSFEFSTGQVATGADLINEWVSCNVALSDIGVGNMKREFFEKNDKGTWIRSPKKFFEFLLDSASDSKMPEDVIEQFKDIILTGKKVRLESFTDREWIESRLVSKIGKEVIDIKTPGGMFIQQSPFGLYAHDVYSRGDQLKTEEDIIAAGNGRRMLNDGLPLDFYKKSPCMEVIVSINLFNDVLPSFLKSHDDKVAWLKRNKLIGRDSEPGALGYRIPSQGLSSMARMKVVDVYPSGFDGVITLPSEFTKLTGSDFDIDKLYVARYSYKKKYNNKKVVPKEAALERVNELVEEYRDELIFLAEDEGRLEDIEKYENDDSYVKSEFIKNYYQGELKYDAQSDEFYYADYDIERPSIDDSKDNKYKHSSPEAIKNRLLQVFMAVLGDKDSVDEVLQPLDTASDYLKDKVVADIEKNLAKEDKYPPALTYVSPSYQSVKRYEYTTGKAGTAVSALNNAHHILAQAFGLRLSPTALLNTIGIGRLDLVYDKNGRMITEWLNALISAHVDIARDPYIMRLNVNPLTYNMMFLLLRAGVGDDTFFFLSQPILKELAKEVSFTTGEERFDRTLSDAAILEQAIQRLMEKYDKQYRETAALSGRSPINTKAIIEQTIKGKLRKQDIVKFANEKSLSKDYLKESMSLRESDPEFYLRQIKLLKLFQALSPTANKLGGLVSAMQVDTKKYGISIVSMHLYRNKLKKFVSENGSGTFINLPKFINKSFIMEKMDNSFGVGSQIIEGQLSKTLPTVMEFVQFSGQYLGKSYDLTDRAFTKIANGLQGKEKAAFFDAYAKKNDIVLRDMFFGPNTMAKRLAAIQRKIARGGATYEYLKNNALLNDIIPEFGFKKTDPDFIKLKDRNSNENDVVAVRKAYWHALLDSADEELSKFAKDLIAYQFYTSGDKTGRSYVKLGEDDREAIGLYDHVNEYMKKLESGPIEDREAMIDDILANKWYDNELVPTIVSKKTRKNLEQEVTTTYATSIYSIERSTTLGRYPLILSGEFSRPISYEFGISPIGKQELMPRFSNIVKSKVTGSQVKVDIVRDKLLPPTAITGTIAYLKSRDTYYSFINGAWEEKVLDLNEEFVLYKLLGIEYIPPTEKDAAKYIPMYGAISKRGGSFGTSYIYEYNKPSSIIVGNDIPTEFKLKKGETSAQLLMRVMSMYNYLREGYEKVGQKMPSETVDAYKTIIDSMKNMYPANALENLYGGSNPLYSNYEFPQQIEDIVTQAIDDAFAYSADGRTVVVVNNTMFDLDVLGAKIGKLGYSEEDIVRAKLEFAFLALEDLESMKNSLNSLDPEKDSRLFEIEALIAHLTDASAELNLALDEIVERGKIMATTGLKLASPGSGVPSEHKMFSGGADGSDSIFESEAKAYGVEVTAFIPEHVDHLRKTKPGAFNESLKAYGAAQEVLGRKYYDVFSKDKKEYYPAKLMIRDYFQAKAADAVYAVGNIIASREYSKEKNGVSYENKANHDVVDGGTGYAVQMAITLGKPVYVYQQETTDSATEGWYAYNSEIGKFVEVDIPKLSSKFAGIGTRDINDAGTKAIKDLMENTFGAKSGEYTESTPKSTRPEMQGEKFNAPVNFSIDSDFTNPNLIGFNKWVKLVESSVASFPIPKFADNELRAAISKEFKDMYTKLKDITYEVYKAEYLAKNPGESDAKIRPIYKARMSALWANMGSDLVSFVRNYVLSNNMDTFSSIISEDNNYSRGAVMRNSETLYIFTDNTDRTSGSTANVGGWYADKYGQGLSYGTIKNPTTAVIRGLDNAFPISTMRYYAAKRFGDNSPESLEKARWHDSDIEEFKLVISDEINEIRKAMVEGSFEGLTIPGYDAFFNSRIADISETRVPVIYAYLKQSLSDLYAYVDGKAYEMQSSYVTPQEVTPEVVEKEVEDEVKGGDISSTSTRLEFALTNSTFTSPKGYPWAESHYAKDPSIAIWKSHMQAGIVYNGVTYADVEEAYQKNKHNFEIGDDRDGFMVDLIKIKLMTYPKLIEGIYSKGGLDYILNSTHNPRGDGSYWETSGENGFIFALADAFTEASMLLSMGDYAPDAVDNTEVGINNIPESTEDFSYADPYANMGLDAETIEETYEYQEALRNLEGINKALKEEGKAEETADTLKEYSKAALLNLVKCKK